MQGRLKREARYRHAGRTGRKAAQARGAGTYLNSASANVPRDAAVKTSLVNSKEEDICCSCGVGNAGPPGPPGNDGEKGRILVDYKIEENCWFN